MKKFQTRRIVAFIVDSTIIGLFAGFFDGFFSDMFQEKVFLFFNQEIKVKFSIAFVFYLIYFFLFDLLNKGTTLGKLLTQIRIVSSNSKSLSVVDLMLRTVLKLISIIFLPIAAIIYLLSDSFTVHDALMKTQTMAEKPSLNQN
jgi:uncharacterized RDD family membrane protein YckC